jgi:hypothetical protein
VFLKSFSLIHTGRNNVITGVAKTIKTHFEKHPLAIVNIKNRADGTSVQQLISELEVLFCLASIFMDACLLL